MSTAQQEARLRDVLELSSVFYWEQDEQYRFTLIKGADFGTEENDPQRLIGKRRWELGRIPCDDDGSWDAHRATLDARQPFADFLYKATDAEVSARYYTCSGRPMFDASGRFFGYCGTAQDITSRVRLQQRLNIEHGVEHLLASANTIAEAGPKILQLICQTLGWACGVRWDEHDNTPRCVDIWNDESPAIDRFLDVASNAADGLISIVSITAGAPSPQIRAVSNRFAKAFYFRPDDNALKGYLGTHIVKAVTEKIGTFDPKAFAEAMKNIHLSAKEHPGILMDVCYDEHGDLDRESFVVEVRKGKQEVIATLPPMNKHKATPAAAQPLSNTSVALAKNQSPVKIAVVVELSGSGKMVGSSFRDGVSLAVNEINADGGILGRKIHVSIFDTETNPEVAKRMVQKAVDSGAYVVMGPVRSDPAIVSMAVSRRAQIPHFVGARAAPVTQVGNPYVFRTDFTAAASMPMFARLIKDRLRAKSVSILWIDNDFGKSARSEMLKALEALRIRVAADVSTAPGQMDFTDAVRQVKEANADAVFIALTEEEGARALRELRKQNIDKPLLGETALVGHQALASTRQIAPPSVEAQDLVRAAWNKGETLWISDIAKDGMFMRTAAAKLAGLRSVVTLPITDEARLVGMFEFFSSEVQHLDMELLKTLTLTAGQIGRFLERERTQKIVRESEARFRSLTELSSDWYWEQDEELRFIFQSHGSFEQSDHGAKTSIGKRRWELPNVAPETNSWDEHRAILAARKPFRNFIVRRLNDDGKTLYISINGAPIFDESGRFTGYRGVGRDITDVRLADERIQYLATHDGLTGLPNRTMFSHLLTVALVAARRYERKFAVFFVDLDRFKQINDTLGHEAGDELLKEMSRRFKECLRDSDAVARLGGDEFVMLAHEVAGAAQAARIARKILVAATAPMEIMGVECRVTASVGVALYPLDGEDEQSLMKNADLAMYRAKEEGRNNFKSYSRKIKSQPLEKMVLET